MLASLDARSLYIWSVSRVALLWTLISSEVDRHGLPSPPFRRTTSPGRTVNDAGSGVHSSEHPRKSISTPLCSVVELVRLNVPPLIQEYVGPDGAFSPSSSSEEEDGRASDLGPSEPGLDPPLAEAWRVRLLNFALLLLARVLLRGELWGEFNSESRSPPSLSPGDWARGDPFLMEEGEPALALFDGAESSFFWVLFSVLETPLAVAVRRLFEERRPDGGRRPSSSPPMAISSALGSPLLMISAVGQSTSPMSIPWVGLALRPDPLPLPPKAANSSSSVSRRVMESPVVGVRSSRAPPQLSVDR
mmetsp:Transcript_4351/g.9988  ORF Transcript_4351/g.9988 Transcript_4351/m.9988 type:complete len:304 (-) Transcript_4351:79-990(-)